MRVRTGEGFAYATRRPQFTRAGGQPRVTPATCVVAAADGCSLAEIADALEAHSSTAADAGVVSACIPPLCFDLRGAPGEAGAERDAWMAKALCNALAAGGAAQKAMKLVVVLPPRGAGPPLSAPPCVAACAAVLRAGATPEVAAAATTIEELRSALFRGHSTQASDVLGDAAASCSADTPLRRLLDVHPGGAETALAAVARWADKWMVQVMVAAVADLRAQGKGSSLEAAHGMHALGVALAAQSRGGNATARAEAVALLRASLRAFCNSPERQSLHTQTAIGACLDALARVMAESAETAGCAAAQAPQQLRGRVTATVALRASLCIDTAALVAMLGVRINLRFIKWALPQSIAAVWPVLVRFGPAAALFIHVIVALLALARLASNTSKQRRAQAAPKAATLPQPSQAASASLVVAPPVTLSVAEAVRAFDAAAVAARMAAEDAAMSPAQAAAALRTPSPPKAGAQRRLSPARSPAATVNIAVLPRARSPAVLTPTPASKAVTRPSTPAASLRSSPPSPAGGSAPRESRWVAPVSAQWEQTPARVGTSPPVTARARVVHLVRL